MSASLQASKSQQRPFSADVSHLTKARLRSSNCPTIVKHEIMSPLDTFQFGTEKSLLPDRPHTATSTKMKFSFLQNMKTVTSPGSVRPASAVTNNNTINFDFLNNIKKAGNGKFQDRSQIKPLKKLKTEQFHSIIYRVKQQKETLEKEINRMEQWHRDFKDNDIWSTPQTAIVESILRLNAQSNPDGNVSRYLQSERDKEEYSKFSKKYQRPTSSYSVMPKVTPKNAKSVTDFFSPHSDYESEQVIEEVLGPNRNYQTQYNSNKRNITEKMNTFVENLENYNTLANSPNGPNGLAIIGSAPTLMKEYLQKSGKKFIPAVQEHSDTIEEQHEKTFSDIAEDNEGSDIPSSSNLKNISKTHQSQLPYHLRPASAQVQVRTALSPKAFSSSNGFKTNGTPAAIHTRPQTAKFMKTSPTSAIAVGLAASGEMRQQSITNVKFVPISLEGQRIQLSNSINFDGKENEGMKGLRPKASGRKMIKIADYYDTERYGQKTSEKRGMSATNRPSTATQTRPFFGVEAPFSAGKGVLVIPTSAKGTVGRVNIDGDYFDTFNDSRPQSKGIYGITTPTGGKSVMETWPNKEGHPYL